VRDAAGRPVRLCDQWRALCWETCTHRSAGGRRNRAGQPVARRRPTLPRSSACAGCLENRVRLVAGLRRQPISTTATRPAARECAPRRAIFICGGERTGHEALVYERCSALAVRPLSWQRRRPRSVEWPPPSWDGPSLDRIAWPRPRSTSADQRRPGNAEHHDLVVGRAGGQMEEGTGAYPLCVGIDVAADTFTAAWRPRAGKPVWCGNLIRCHSGQDQPPPQAAALPSLPHRL
jgi:hypothetical protein